VDESVERSPAWEASAATYGAILVDEGQDFAPSWLKLARHTLKAKRGGMVVACDMAQAIYREEILANIFPHEEYANVKLTRNYRNTAQIGHFAVGAVFGDQVPVQIEQTGNPNGRNPPLSEFVLDGPPVQLVWADRWDAQAKFVAQEIRQLVDERRASYRDIAVLYTQYMGTVKRILPALEVEKIPYFWVNQNRDTRDAVDMSESSVKVMTVHSSKGMEFPIVFLFGVEALRVPGNLRDASTDEANLTRVAYVGMTRAQDILYLTYTRANPIIDRALQMVQCAEYKNYPEDYHF
jgi:superfamily I DNA/RNA helicase